MKDLFESEFKNKNSTLLNAAQKLAITFSEEKNIPLQYRKGLDRLKKTNDDSQIMSRFKISVNIWKDVISKILEKVEPNMAWRFINLKPQIDGNTKSVVYNNDFIEFTDYFVLRRDIENCDDDELGCLAQLHGLVAYGRKLKRYRQLFQRQAEPSVPVGECAGFTVFYLDGYSLHRLLRKVVNNYPFQHMRLAERSKNDQGKPQG